MEKMASRLMVKVSFIEEEDQPRVGFRSFMSDLP